MSDDSSELDDPGTAAGLSLREVLAAEDDEQAQEAASRHYAADEDADDEQRTDDLPAAILPYLKPDELQVIATQQHTIRLWLPGGVFVGGLVAAIVANALLYVDGHASIWPVRAVWLAFTLGALWSAWRYAEWRQTWFVVTAGRLIVIQGVLSRSVDMLPISKLRDVHYVQSWFGRLLGYATFVCDSIATEGALRTIGYLPYPEYLYREVCKLVIPHDQGLPPGRGSNRGRGSRRR